MTNKLTTRLAVLHQDTRNPAPLSQRQRLDLLRRLLTVEDLPLLDRVAAILMLLYAQPLTRVLRLTLDDVLDATPRSTSAQRPHGRAAPARPASTRAGRRQDTSQRVSRRRREARQSCLGRWASR